jgi:hypothetical protein
LVSILLDLAQGALQFLLLGTRSNACGPQKFHSTVFSAL